jgi:tRNA nucleotidyltransferase/poly(A) polymerase
MLQPEEQRRFAAEVVRRLREAGFTAYWAGGCVRDQLLGRTPKDYDVATSAVPQEIRTLFGRRCTLAIGAAFGVISVIGPKAAGTVEAATFRRDAAYSDGRHPDSVTFSSPVEDASRRDFTVNGLFYDPVENCVIDFVGGQEDLAKRRLRAIGSPRDRIAEDKLRMLRAVRFATVLGFTLEEKTREAVVEMAPEIHAVSPERIAAEMRRLLADPNRAAGVRLLLETGLAAEVLPEITAGQASSGTHVMTAILSLLAPNAEFPLALAAVLTPFVDPAGAEAVCRRWRLSNKETERIVWLVEHHAALKNAPAMRWSLLHPLLTADGADDLLKLTEAASAEGALAAEHCRRLLTQPREKLDPPPLLTGADLLALGIPAGPKFKVILDRIRTAQLDGEIRTKADAMKRLKNEN